MNTQNNSELIKTGREFSDKMTLETALIDIVKMMSSLASQLDLTTAAMREKCSRFDTLAVKNSELKTSHDTLVAENISLTGGCGFFAYDPDGGFYQFKTRAKAIEAAESYIDHYRDYASDGWPDDVSDVCWGVVLQQSTKVNEEVSVSDYNRTVCDFALLPAVETPATDAAIAGFKAQGVEEFASDLGKAYQHLRAESPQAKALKAIVLRAVSFSAQLHKGAGK